MRESSREVHLGGSWLIVPAFQHNKRHLPKQDAPADSAMCVMMRSFHFQFNLPLPIIALVHPSFNGFARVAFFTYTELHRTNS